ncbi:TonB-dependent receptor [Candidatus Fermentibacteria bacterium]|nr:TonB-dependent receptor [Candidatus Fermentibacteria bacterium]
MTRWTALILLSILLIVPATAFAQGRGTIEGRVTDARSGTALEGANIVVKGTPFGTASDVTGRFTIQNVPVGTYDLEAYYIGYENLSQQVMVIPGGKVLADFGLVSTILEGGSVVVTASRAVERETPIAFTDVTKEQMDKAYTTQDVPALLTTVPGVFTSSSGLGESDLYIRGFDSERVQILINGIPVNDPESQVVYWSNWTGLASNATSIQVQRGAGSSLYGSGAFGGSLNVETMGVSSRKGLSFRSSLGMLTTNGAEEGANAGQIADGEGGFEDYSPINYMASLRYNSGLVMDNKLIFSASAERKGGDSYVNATNYDGWSFGFDAKAILSKHIMTFSFIGAPQSHNQAYANQDMELLDTLGWEYNRYNHPYQENYYFKPQFSLRHDWIMSDASNLSTNYFVTFGRGGGKYLRNDRFNVETGEVTFQDLSESNDTKYFGRNAWYIYGITGGAVTLTGFNPADTTFNGVKVTSARSLIPGDYAHSWHNDSVNDHNQFGLNTVFRTPISTLGTAFIGGEARLWKADHYAKSYKFRHTDAAGNLLEDPEVERRYDYSSTVMNMSGFARLQLQPMERLNAVVDGQYASYSSKVEENPVRIWDFEARRFIDAYYRVSMDLKNADGTPKFTDSDYERTYSFFSPKFGLNYNVNEQLNVLANYSIAYKEPKTGDWYNRGTGPNTEQELDPEKSANIEFGAGYRTGALKLDANYYILNFEDKIESIYDRDGSRVTINAGKAKHSGLELAATAGMGPVDFSGSLTLAQNRWQKIDVQQIFGAPADSVADKVVPFSPEKMASAAVGYTLGALRVGLSTRWFDDYYASYTNNYQLADGTWEEAKLPSFLELNADLSYGLKLADRNVNLRLDLNNLANRQNFAKAQWAADYGRNDDLNGDNYMYVAQSPLFNAFFTVEIVF